MVFEIIIFFSLGLLLIYGVICTKLYNTSTIITSLTILTILIWELILLFSYYIICVCEIISLNFNSTNYIIRIILTLISLLYLISLYWQLKSRLLLSKMSIDKFYLHNICTLKTFESNFNSQSIAIKKVFLFFTKTVSYEFYLLFVALLNSFLILISTTTYITFYITFELVSVLIYLLLSFQKTKQNIEAVIRYFFFGLLASTFMLWGLNFIYSTLGTIHFQSIIDLNNSLTFSYQENELLIGYILVISALLIKLGVFPYHFWVIKVYPNLSNITFLLMITVVNSGFIIAFLQILNYLIKCQPNHLIFITIFLVLASLGSLVFGCLLLLTQTTVKGFLASNSILNTSFLILCSTALLNLHNILWTQLNFIWLILYYLLIYNCLTFILFNSWSALNLWNWKKKFNIQYEINNFNYKNILALLKNKLPANVLWNDFKSPKSFQLVHYTKFETINRQIKRIFNFLTFLNVTQVKLKQLKYPQITYLINLKYSITTIYRDYNLFLFVWIMWGFPPFLVFILIIDSQMNRLVLSIDVWVWTI